ncbi:magnesium-dependent phosphatase-1 [Blastopirellula marina]|uniref:Magnesium-dependent phosphatase-1 n=1 Tax=Blastopirellula marina TaxID=124 RepID=A0A2S8GUY2_9BACT|nr:magnesium-dependent phosphatase-1 [Blastopirellula marina]PQO47864.1 magnesium-dependent phosphatase-1 [Blastopirellula marina]
MTAPRLIVFDLDFTLWDCGGTWCDCLTPPFRMDRQRVVDRHSRHVRFYDDVPSILEHCRQAEIPMALASRTEQPKWARQLLELLDITSEFAHAEIYPSSKLRHFAALQKASGVAYHEMIFFDDEMRNIREVSGLGVTSIYVENGLTVELFHAGLDQHASNRLGR